MTLEDIREDAGVDSIEKTDVQILRELYGSRGRRGITRRSILSPDEQSEHQDDTAAMADEEREGQTR